MFSTSTSIYYTKKKENLLLHVTIASILYSIHKEVKSIIDDANFSKQFVKKCIET